MCVYACFARGQADGVLAALGADPAQVERLPVEPVTDGDVLPLHADVRLDPGGATLCFQKSYAPVRVCRAHLVRGRELVRARGSPPSAPEPLVARPPQAGAS
jgi:hypothetical protein